MRDDEGPPSFPSIMVVWSMGVRDERSPQRLAAQRARLVPRWPGLGPPGWGGRREGKERKRSNGEAVPDRNVGIYFTHMLHYARRRYMKREAVLCGRGRKEGSHTYFRLSAAWLTEWR